MRHDTRAGWTPRAVVLSELVAGASAPHGGTAAWGGSPSRSYFIPPGLPLAIPTARQLLEFIAEAAAVVAVTVTGPRACCCLERPCFALIDPLGVATSAGGHDARTPSDALELAENVWLRRGGSKGRHGRGGDRVDGRSEASDGERTADRRRKISSWYGPPTTGCRQRFLVPDRAASNDRMAEAVAQLVSTEWRVLPTRLRQQSVSVC